MNCKNHPTVEAVDRCVGCAETFCKNCLVEIEGQQYCSDCKYMTVDEVTLEPEKYPCKEAGEALRYAIIGIFCFGIILAPMAISKANKAKQMIAENPQLTGLKKANTAIGIAVAVLVLWVIGVMARVSQF